MPEQFLNLEWVMRRALEVARRGEGLVEPNPMVGAVVVDEQLRLLGEGWHERFGGPHAEVNALRQAGTQAAGATLVVTLEPCCHTGKTPPCTRAIVEAGLRRVIIGLSDPAPHNSGKGIEELRQAGIDVELGLLQDECARLVDPFVTLMTTGRPYVHAKWAMTLDGKIASRTGASKWISNRASREVVHSLRGRMDAVIVGIGTALADDPLLTARPPGPRTATRIVMDSSCRLPSDSQLVRTARDFPVLVAVSSSAHEERVQRLLEAGVEAMPLHIDAEGHPDLRYLLQELGSRQMTNVLIEGGGRLLGASFDQGLIDELHVFMAPKIIGGSAAVPPLSGVGLGEIPQRDQLDGTEVQLLDGDVYIRARLRRENDRKTLAPPP